MTTLRVIFYHGLKSPLMKHLYTGLSRFQVVRKSPLVSVESRSNLRTITLLSLEISRSGHRPGNVASICLPGFAVIIIALTRTNPGEIGASYRRSGITMSTALRTRRILSSVKSLLEVIKSISVGPSNNHTFLLMATSFAVSLLS